MLDYVVRDQQLQSSNPNPVLTTAGSDGLLQEQDECRQASKFRLHAWGAIQLASNPAPTPLTLLHGTSGLGEAAADVVDQAESPAKSVRPGATLGQSLRAKGAVSMPSTAHFQTQVSNHITSILASTRLGLKTKKKVFHVICTMGK